MSDWFGASWQAIGYVALGTLAIYVTMLVGVRLAGRRTISQLSAFDGVVTVALGSTMASTALSENPSYAHGATVIVTLLSLQVALAAVRQRWALARRILDFPPQAVVKKRPAHVAKRPTLVAAVTRRARVVAPAEGASSTSTACTSSCSSLREASRCRPRLQRLSLRRRRQPWMSNPDHSPNDPFGLSSCR